MAKADGPYDARECRSAPHDFLPHQSDLAGNTVTKAGGDSSAPSGYLITVVMAVALVLTPFVAPVPFVVPTPFDVFTTAKGAVSVDRIAVLLHDDRAGIVGRAHNVGWLLIDHLGLLIDHGGRHVDGRRREHREAEIDADADSPVVRLGAEDDTGCNSAAQDGAFEQIHGCLQSTRGAKGRLGLLEDNNARASERFTGFIRH